MPFPWKQNQQDGDCSNVQEQQIASDVQSIPAAVEGPRWSDEFSVDDNSSLDTVKGSDGETYDLKAAFLHTGQQT